MSERSIAYTWGTNAEERALVFPGDRPSERDGTQLLWRGIDVDAPPSVVFRWLCQMRVAPYSYDWIDNLGRTSPRTLTPGLDQLARGQRFMIFVLEDFAQDEHLVLATPAGSRAARLFGLVHGTYWCRQRDGGRRTRLLVKLRVRPAPGIYGALTRWLLPWGDLVMMRKQLQNLRDLAEGTGGPRRSPDELRPPTCR
jgi:hypothetical protein